MFFLAKLKDDDSSSSSPTGRPALRRHDTFGSVELFQAWARDSFINQSTVDILVKTHQIDCLPAVLALKQEDFALLNLPVGQRRLLEDAVGKLRQEYDLVQPPTPKATINLEMPVYKSMLEIGDQAEEADSRVGLGDSESSQESLARSRLESQWKDERGKRLELTEQQSTPEKEALLDSEHNKTTAREGQHTKDGPDSPRTSQGKFTISDDSDEDEYTACACQRWLLVVLFMPLFIVLSILGFIVVLLLLPLRLCCPQGGVYTNLVTLFFECLIMAPCLACKWAAGKGRRHSNTTGGKPHYGGTDDVEPGNK